MVRRSTGFHRAPFNRLPSHYYYYHSPTCSRYSLSCADSLMCRYCYYSYVRVEITRARSHSRCTLWNLVISCASRLRVRSHSRCPLSNLVISFASRLSLPPSLSFVHPRKPSHFSAGPRPLLCLGEACVDSSLTSLTTVLDSLSSSTFLFVLYLCCLKKHFYFGLVSHVRMSANWAVNYTATKTFVLNRRQSLPPYLNLPCALFSPPSLPPQ